MFNHSVLVHNVWNHHPFFTEIIEVLQRYMYFRKVLSSTSIQNGYMYIEQQYPVLWCVFNLSWCLQKCLSTNHIDSILSRNLYSTICLCSGQTDKVRLSRGGLPRFNEGGDPEFLLKIVVFVFKNKKKT